LSPKVGIVVPTLGMRPEYLRQCLASIREAGEAHVVLVAPRDFESNSLKAASLIDDHIPDPGKGLAEAINAGFRSLPSGIQLINWLGDDDLLARGSISKASKLFSQFPNLVMVFGSCNYIDPKDSVLWTNKSGQWAVPLLRFGPDLIPQPGALFFRPAFESLGGLDPNLQWAFDFDLFIRLSKIGKIRFVDETLSSFRWHPESLSVEFRAQAVLEASQVRVSHLPNLLKSIAQLWEYPVRQATLLAGARMNSRARRKAIEA
jgi:GT2 family glycosyltransferase